MVGGFKALEHWQETSFCNQTGPLLRLANRIYINKESPLLHCMHFTTNLTSTEWIFWKMCLIISLEFCRENYLRSLLFPNTIRRIRKKQKRVVALKLVPGPFPWGGGGRGMKPNRADVVVFLLCFQFRFALLSTLQHFCCMIWSAHALLLIPKDESWNTHFLNSEGNFLDPKDFFYSMQSYIKDKEIH